CTVNVQHNCLDNQCAIRQTRVRQQEGEEAPERVSEVVHQGDLKDFILNTAQMRSAAHIHPL
ncbi:hypothetical protein EV122DRAFT_180971, partial [Schizophyllum commune]